MQKNDLDNNTGENHTGKQANSPLRLLTASSIRGDKVFNKAGESLGKISDIMLNVEDGKIQYIVIAFGGFIGISQKYFAVPFDELIIQPDDHAFILDRTRESFENNPGFDKNHWPEANSHLDVARYGSGFMGANTGADH
jgi:sporulation protein YlmC with PRC-barrel domain